MTRMSRIVADRSSEAIGAGGVLSLAAAVYRPTLARTEAHWHNCQGFAKAKRQSQRPYSELERGGAKRRFSRWRENSMQRPYAEIAFFTLAMLLTSVRSDAAPL